MKSLIIAILILIIFPLEIIITLCTLSIYLLVMNCTITERLVEKL